MNLQQLTVVSDVSMLGFTRYSLTNLLTLVSVYRIISVIFGTQVHWFYNDHFLFYGPIF